MAAGGSNNLELGVVFKATVSKQFDREIAALKEKIKKLREDIRKVVSEFAKINKFDLGGLPKLRDYLRDINNYYKNIIQTAGRASKSMQQLATAANMSEVHMSKYSRGFAMNMEEFLAKTVKFFIVWRTFWAVFNWLKMVISDFKEFQKELGTTAGVVMATKSELVGLKNAAYETSKITGIALSEVAKGMTVLAQAGLNAKETMLALKPIALLARATGTSFESSSNVVTTAMRVWNIEADRVGNIANVMAGAANFSKLTIEGLSTAFNYLAPTAKLAGWNLEQAAAAAAVLTNAGVKASTVGTGLSNFLSNLAAKTPKLAKQINEAGGSIENLFDKMGNIKPMQDIIKYFVELRKGGFQLQDVFQGLEMRSGRSLGAALSQTSQAFAMMEVRLQHSTSLGIMFAQAMEPATVKLDLLMNKIKIDMIQVFDNWSNAIYSLVKALTFLAKVSIPSVIIALVLLASKFIMLKAVAMATASALARGEIIFLSYSLSANAAASSVYVLGNALKWLTTTTLGWITLGLAAIAVIYGIYNAFKKEKISIEEINAKYAEQEGLLIKTSAAVEDLLVNMDDMTDTKRSKAVSDLNNYLGQLGIKTRLATSDVNKLKDGLKKVADLIHDKFLNIQAKKLLDIDSSGLPEMRDKLEEIYSTIEKIDNKALSVVGNFKEWMKAITWMGKNGPSKGHIFFTDDDWASYRKNLIDSASTIQDSMDKINAAYESGYSGFLEKGTHPTQVVKRLLKSLGIDELEQAPKLIQDRIREIWKSYNLALFQKKEAEKKEAEKPKPGEKTLQPTDKAAIDAEASLNRAKSEYDIMFASEFFNYDKLKAKANEVAAAEVALAKAKHEQDRLATTDSGEWLKKQYEFEKITLPKIREEAARRLEAIEEKHRDQVRRRMDLEEEIGRTMTEVALLQDGQSARLDILIGQRKKINVEIEKQKALLAEIAGQIPANKQASIKQLELRAEAWKDIKNAQIESQKVSKQIVDTIMDNNPQILKSYDDYINKEMELSQMKIESGKYNKYQLLDQQKRVVEAKAVWLAQKIAMQDFAIAHAKEFGVADADVQKYKNELMGMKADFAELGNEVSKVPTFWQNIARQIGDSIQNDISSKLGDLITGIGDSEDAMQEFLDSMRSAIGKTIAQLLIFTTLWNTVGKFGFGAKLLDMMGIPKPGGGTSEVNLEAIKKATVLSTTIEQGILLQLRSMAGMGGLTPAVAGAGGGEGGAEKLFGMFAMFMSGGFSRGGMIRKYANGGMVWPGRKDSVLAAMEPGEFVIPAGVTKMIGENMLNRLREGKAGEYGSMKEKGAGVAMPTLNSSTTNLFQISATDAPSFSRLLATRPAQEMIANGISNKFRHNSPVRRVIRKGR